MLTAQITEKKYMQLLEMMDILFYYNHFSVCIMFCMLNIHNKTHLK